jgi:hypothetical protein
MQSFSRRLRKRWLYESTVQLVARLHQESVAKMKGPGSIKKLTLKAPPITSNLSDSERSCHQRPGQQIATDAIATGLSAGHCHWSGSAM